MSLSSLYLYLIKKGKDQCKCNHKETIRRVYLKPVIASPMVTTTLSVNFILNLAWVFILDRSVKLDDIHM